MLHHSRGTTMCEAGRLGCPRLPSRSHRRCAGTSLVQLVLLRLLLKKAVLILDLLRRCKSSHLICLDSSRGSQPAQRVARWVARRQLASRMLALERA